MLPPGTRIAGRKTVADWQAAKASLTIGADPARWDDAYGEFFAARLETRYFAPIRALEAIAKKEGEGFSIVALHCTLIEFLASTLEGKTYRFQRNGKPTLGTFEYSKSREMFVSFLIGQEPFKTMFSKAGSADDFYASVRCGLLHEARTKNGWQIRYSSSAKTAIDAQKKVIYRNKMQQAFDSFAAVYRAQLISDASLQAAFLRKFDSLCED